jgi:hypothetical protein
MYLLIWNAIYTQYIQVATQFLVFLARAEQLERAVIDVMRRTQWLASEKKKFKNGQLFTYIIIIYILIYMRMMMIMMKAAHESHLDGTMSSFMTTL